MRFPSSLARLHTTTHAEGGTGEWGCVAGDLFPGRKMPRKKEGKRKRRLLFGRGCCDGVVLVHLSLARTKTGLEGKKGGRKTYIRDREGNVFWRFSSSQSFVCSE